MRAAPFQVESEAVNVESEAVDFSAQPRGAATIERSLAVVTEILDEGGESSLRLADVSRRSGVSIGSLYHHFGSREGLIKAARERQFIQSLPQDAGTIAELLETAESVHELLERVEAYVHVTQSPERAPNRLRRVELIGAAASRPELLDAISSTQTIVLDIGESIATTLQTRGWLREGVEPRSFALFVQAVTLGLVLGDLDQRGTDHDAWVALLMIALRSVIVDDAA